MTRAATVAIREEPGTEVPVERLRAALDGHVVAAALRGEGGHPNAAGLVACHADRVFPRGALGYVIAYELHFRDGDARYTERRLGELVAGDPGAHYREAALSLRKRRRRQLRGAPDAADMTWLPDPGIVLRRPGLDERLNGLRLLREPERLLASLAPPTVAATAGRPTATLLAHRLGKRCVVRFDGTRAAAGDAASLIGKMYATGRGRAQAAFETLGRLSDAGLGAGSAVRIPRPVAWLPEWDTVLMEDVSRAPVCCVSGDDPAAGASAAGRALRALHACPLLAARRHGVDEEIALLDAWVELVGQVYPDRRQVFRQARAWTAAELERCRRFEPVLAHRDFHEQQVAVGAGATVLMDFDTLCRSDPALDAGNFLAHLELAELEGRIECADALAQAFLDGYVSVSGPAFAARVAAWQRATVLRLACLNAFSARRRELVAGLLELL